MAAAAAAAAAATGAAEDDAWLAGVGEEWLEGSAEERLREQFAEAVEFLNTDTGLIIPEEVQRRLYGLHARASRGEAPSEVPADLREEQWRAWAEAGGLTAVEAMRAYVAAAKAIGGQCEAPGAGTKKELPPELAEKLAAAGIRQADGPGSSREAPAAPEAADVFAAARAGRGLGAFLPAQRDEVDEDGLTPLHHATDAEQSAAVRELLAVRADPSIADGTGALALHIAALLGASEIAELLVAAGAPLDRRDEDGARPADVARAEGHAALAERLAPPPGA